MWCEVIWKTTTKILIVWDVKDLQISIGKEPFKPQLLSSSMTNLDKFTKDSGIVDAMLLWLNFRTGVIEA